MRPNLLQFAIGLLGCLAAMRSARQPVYGASPEGSTPASLHVRFMFQGDRPATTTLDGSRDPYCADKIIPDEQLVVGDDRAIRDCVLIWDERRNRHLKPAAYPPPEKSTVLLELQNCGYSPRIVLLRSGQTLQIDNLDPVGHNSNLSLFNNPESGLTVPAGEPQRRVLLREEPVPCPISCSIHPWEKAWLIVKEHPYVGISDAAGQITIQGLPTGENRFRLWHERLAPDIQTVLLNGREFETEGRNRVLIDLRPGRNDLGIITLTAAHFQLPSRQP